MSCEVLARPAGDGQQPEPVTHRLTTMGVAMKLSKTALSAACACVYLAGLDQTKLVPAKDIGKFLEMPTDSVLKILQTLVRGGVLTSRLGRSGGYRLAQPAEQTSLLSVVEAIDGSIQSRCATQTHSLPADVLQGRIAEICRHASEAASSKLQQVSLRDLLSDNSLGYLSTAC